MFGEPRRIVIGAVVLGVLLVLTVFGLVIRSQFSTRAEIGELSNFTTSSQTTVYVDPARCPLCQASGNGGVLPGEGQSGGQTPDVSGETGSGSGGILSGWFSGVPRDLPAGYAAKDLSPYFRKVRIGSVKTYAGSAAATNADTVRLNENIGSGDPAVTITGWKLQANQGSYVIQRAAKTYKTAGSVLGDVSLANGQAANVYSGASAVRANFMGNSCMGYLSSQYAFVPKLTGSCSRPAKSEIATFSGACQEYILRLKACEAGNPDDSRIPAGDSACRAFVATLTYDGCVKRRQDAEGFYTNVWNIWSGKKFLDPLHDRVLLLDANGKLVDYYLY